ncbi:MAG TPA: ABC transporter permease subunit [Candidatus Sulfotelmatobacter sp.]|nr:ABC transporter permease subunit [Candidatus Sulfotelmatobacter sp.]
MPRRRPDTLRAPRRFALIRAAAWDHRWGAASWGLATAAFLLYFGAGYRATVLSFKGGAAAFGLAASPVAQAMRPLDGPSDRLDTYGGYVTYHNTSIIALLLALWAVIQGARAIRGWEERGGIEIWLATARRRWTLVRDQWLGFVGAVIPVALLYGLGLGGGTAAAGAPDWGGAFIVAGETALVVAFFFGLGLLISQLTTTARSGAGLAVVAMLSVYVLGNQAAGSSGWFGWIRFLSPFFYFQQSRVLVPGHQLDPLATLMLAVAAIVPVVLSALAFSTRDIGASVWPPSPAEARTGRQAARPVRLKGFSLRDAWLFDLRSQALTVAIWAVASAGMMALLVGVAQQVTGVWESSDLIRQMFGRVPGQTFLDHYMAYVGIVAAVAPAAYAVTEASRWVSDLDHRRAAVFLSVTGSRPRLVLEWAASALAGIAVVSVAILAGAILGAAGSGLGLRPEGLLRTAAIATLLGAGIGGVALALVVVLRSGLAVGALGAWLAVGFFISLLGPLFKWPDWLIRLSPFDAFGTPYTSLPRTSGLLLLAGLAIIGTAAAALIGQRRSSLA